MKNKIEYRSSHICTTYLLPQKRSLLKERKFKILRFFTSTSLIAPDMTSKTINCIQHTIISTKIYCTIRSNARCRMDITVVGNLHFYHSVLGSITIEGGENPVLTRLYHSSTVIYTTSS